jgi:hypothetical protein
MERSRDDLYSEPVLALPSFTADVSEAKRTPLLGDGTLPLQQV